MEGGHASGAGPRSVHQGRQPVSTRYLWPGWAGLQRPFDDQDAPLGEERVVHLVVCRRERAERLQHDIAVFRFAERGDLKGECGGEIDLPQPLGRLVPEA